MRYIVFLFLILVSSSYALSCTEHINNATNLYDYRCAARFIHVKSKDYEFTMSFLGGFTGLIFMSSIIYLILNIGKSYKV